MSKETYYIVPKDRTVQGGEKESNSHFVCNPGRVMTGRYHNGDENGKTYYQEATLKAIDTEGKDVSLGEIKVEVNEKWSDYITESSGDGYDAPSGYVIVGREHDGDENGKTRYQIARIKVGNEDTKITQQGISNEIKESAGIWYETEIGYVITGRHHSGDENGMTYYCYGKITLERNVADEPAPPGTVLKPDTTKKDEKEMDENVSKFICKENHVLIGRKHEDDEKGKTTYISAPLKAVDKDNKAIPGEITVEDIRWGKPFKESSGKGFDAPVGRVLVGRIHRGDENGVTLYAHAAVKFNTHPTEVGEYTTSEKIKESGSEFSKEDGYVMTGRHHFGDENGNTYYCMGKISCDVTASKTERFNVVIGMHEEEEYFPMNPLDFIRLSRFRQHVSGGSDKSYNSNTGVFEDKDNRTSSNYYNIPVSTINEYYVTEGKDGENKEKLLFNLRPKDKASIGEGEVFLQPDDHMNGDFDPNGRVPVFTYSTFYEKVEKDKNGKDVFVSGERREFWIFFANNHVTGGSHQGDWERVILDIRDNKIVGAWLSQHTGLTYYPLDIEEKSGTQTLTVYCSKGTHAIYASTGSFSRTGGSDETSAKGYQWKITDCVEELTAQPWVKYAGAWGEVGMYAYTTGPLGPGHKVFDFGKQDELKPPFNDIKYLLRPCRRVENKTDKESSEEAMEAPDGMVMTGRRHSGDENGETIYQWATLEAVDKDNNVIPGTIRIEKEKDWSDGEKESDLDFKAKEGTVIVGRKHEGDENGKTSYRMAKVYFKPDGSDKEIQANVESDSTKIRLIESANVYFIAAPSCVITGRGHSGDENGETYYTQGWIYIPQEKNK